MVAFIAWIMCILATSCHPDDLVSHLIGVNQSLDVLSTAFSVNKKPKKFTSHVFPTANEWLESCDQLPFNREDFHGYKKLVDLTWEEFERTLQATVEAYVYEYLNKPYAWTARSPKPQSPFITTGTSLDVFQPFAQKKMFEPDAYIYFHGDLHGDIKSLTTFLKDLKDKKVLSEKNPFRIRYSNVYLVFLGDYTDRGKYGVEVLYTLMRLKLENFDQVFLVRGNHEDMAITARYGFLSELGAKFGEGSKKMIAVSRLYDLLPVVLYVGCNNDFIQCCHGGVEIGYTPHRLLQHSSDVSYEWIDNLAQLTNFNALPLKARNSFDVRAQAVLKDFVATQPVEVGFLWNDFKVDPQELTSYYSGRGFEYGKESTQAVLLQQSSSHARINGIFRAHQHSQTMSPMMQCILEFGKIYKCHGIGFLWDHTINLQHVYGKGSEVHSAPVPLWEGMVCTFNVGPDSVYGKGANFDYDTYGELRLGATYKDWRLVVHRREVLVQ